MRLAEIAKRIGCEVRGDGNIEIRGLAPIDAAEADTLTFLTHDKRAERRKLDGFSAL